MNTVCLAIPARVISAGPGPKGRVDYLGTKMGADLSLLENVRAGDWVIVHAGFAIAKLNEKEANRTLGYLREMAEPGSPRRSVRRPARRS